MHNLRCGLLFSLLLGAPALAQSTTAPAGGPGSAPAPGAQVQSDLDLPLEKPLYVPPNPPPPPPPAPPPPPPPSAPTSTPTGTTPPPPDPTDAPPPLLYGEEITAESDTLVYVVDQSGSMGWDVQSYLTIDGARSTGPRMDRAKNELSRSILGLAPNFRFNIVAFDCFTRVWSSGGLRQANDANKQSALAWVAGLAPIGATGTAPAVSLGLSLDRSNLSVVLLTDGEPNCGVPESVGALVSPEITASHRRTIQRANTQGARITVFGIAASGPYRQFCQDVAADSGGAYFDVP